MTTIQTDKPATEAVEDLEELWAMSPEERAAAMYAGEVTQRQCFEWACREPHTVPLLEGEFWFIAIHPRGLRERPALAATSRRPTRGVAARVAYRTRADRGPGPRRELDKRGARRPTTR
jgi:hypothetical protein